MSCEGIVDRLVGIAILGLKPKDKLAASQIECLGFCADNKPTSSEVDTRHAKAATLIISSDVERRNRECLEPFVGPTYSEEI